jgi:hypothetical protein
VSENEQILVPQTEAVVREAKNCELRNGVFVNKHGRYPPKINKIKLNFFQACVRHSD